jgi:hypothetical protein
MENHYEINVAKIDPVNHHSAHFFATAPRSCIRMEEMMAVYAEIRAAFPEPFYSVTVTHYACTGRELDMSAKKAVRK